MNSKTKIFTVMLVSIAAAILIIFPLTNAAQSNASLGYGLTAEDLEELKSTDCCAALELKVVCWFLNHSEPVEVDGTVVALTEKMLTLGTGEDQIRVHLPDEWTVDGEVLTLQELFAGGYLSEGESITVKALGADLIDREVLRIYLLVGYEIIDDAGVHAIANMPINIET
jgi:hypothetical protein